MITDAIHDYVAGQLSRLWSLPKPQRRARLAELRRGVGHQPGDLPALWGSFLQELPQRALGQGNGGRRVPGTIGSRVGGLPCPDSLRPAPAGRRERFHE